MNQPRATLAAGMQVTPSVRLVSKLGAGGMGAVWIADHTALNTRVVVKFMLVGLDSSSSARTRFKREAEAASQVKSPHVVQTFDYGVTAEGLPFIVMEHLEGRDLAAEIAARGTLDPVTVITVVTQVAKALTKAHAAGLLHRDIKPDNIFLCQGESEDDIFAKLLDFGIAKTHNVEGEAELDAQTKTGQVIGTPFYMSPEQVTAQKVIDLRSDLWSLAVVTFEALTGKRPYDGPSFGALAVKIATTDPPRPSDMNPALPPSVDAWFAQACAREPAARFRSARELAERLRAAFEGVVSLPPIASGGMSDSGPRMGASPSRTTASNTPVQTPMSSVPAGPISVDDDAHARPSFVLASTVQPDVASSERAALARSEGGGAVAVKERIEDSPHRRGPPSRVRFVAPIVALATIVGAIAIGWKAKEHTTERPDDRTSGESATAKNASSNPASAPVASDPLLTRTATATSASGSVADASAPSALASSPSASASSPSASASSPSGHIAPATTATPPARATTSAPSRASASTSGMVKPTPSVAPSVAPSAHPSTPVQDPLY